MTHDVFISYASKDKPIADAVCAALERNGIRCWIAPRDVLPGTEWGEAIIHAIRECQVMIIVLSSKTNASTHIKREVERAVNRGMTIIPFRIENILPSGSLEYFIGSVHWLDAITPPVEEHIQELVDKMIALFPKIGSENNIIDGGQKSSPSPSELRDEKKPSVMLRATADNKKPERDDVGTEDVELRSDKAEHAQGTDAQGNLTHAGFCVRCGFPNKFSLKYCTECGELLALKFKLCDNCGNRNPQELKFCTSCGSVL